MTLRSKRTVRRGFTLIELLLVIGIIAILASIVIVAINPTRQLGQARNAQRRSDVNTILNAVYQFSIDNNGILPGSMLTGATIGRFYEVCKVDWLPTGAANGCQLSNTTPTSTVFQGVNLRALTGSYVVNIPRDPSLASTATGTNYLISKDANNRITVKPKTAEAGVDPNTLAVTR